MLLNKFASFEKLKKFFLAYICCSNVSYCDSHPQPILNGVPLAPSRLGKPADMVWVG